MTTTTLRLPPRIARLPQLRQIVRGGLAARGSIGAGLAAKAGGAAGNGLLNNLVAYWKLDETTGNRLDSSGNGYTLTVSGSPGSRAGKLGNAVDIPNDSNILVNSADGLRLVPGTSKTWAFWVYHDVAQADAFPFARWPGGAGGDWVFAFDVADGLALAIAASTQGAVATGAGGAPSGQWLHVAGWFDHTIGTYGTIYLCINNGTIYSSAMVAAHTSAISTQTAFGRLGANTFGTFDGAIDEAGIWSVVLTAAQRTALFNSGNGLAYSAFTT